ncbi:hypothetical protein CC80DRAFT_590134 [Byssothecium circinans]|uniref:Uncharacterized protein n=1 Tax=Byssothecium circinans TaxID=147558 RepID=A0A6A5U7F3_9PLEO|nr:hypothetical protein CC80DRAFT_590134 [Byssothecium circinans]
MALQSMSTSASTFLAVFVFTLLITPTAARPHALHVRDGMPGGAYVCAEPNYAPGTCQWYKPNFIPDAPCMNLRPDGSDHVLPVKSFGPDFGTRCQLFMNEGCDPNTWVGDILSPADIPSIKGVMGFVCWATDEAGAAYSKHIEKGAGGSRGVDAGGV